MRNQTRLNRSSSSRPSTLAPTQTRSAHLMHISSGALSRSTIAIQVCVQFARSGVSLAAMNGSNSKYMCVATIVFMCVCLTLCLGVSMFPRLLSAALHPGVLTTSVLVALLVSIGTFCTGILVVYIVRAVCRSEKNALPQPASASSSSSSKQYDSFDSAPHDSDTNKSAALIKPATLRDNFTGARNDLWRLALDPGRSMGTNLLCIIISEPEPGTECET